MTHAPSSSRSAGFTLVEIAIIVPILIVTVLIIFDALFAMIRSSTVESGKIDLTYQRQTAMTNIESDILLASLFLPKIDNTAGGELVVTNDPYPPTANGGAWSYLGDSSTSRVLIARMYSTTTNPLSTTRQPAYVDDNSPVGAACNASYINFNAVQQYNMVYFVKNGNLFRRKLTDKTTALCSPGQYQKFSCPSQLDLTAQGLGTRNSVCEADDELLLENVSNFSVQYYLNKSDTTPLAVYATGADPALVTTAADVEITLTATKKIAGKSTSVSSTMRISKLNSKTGE